MRRTVIAVIASLAALLAPAAARADAMPVLAAPRIVSKVAMLNLAYPGFASYHFVLSERGESTLRARVNYEVMASLPMTTTQVKTYDWRPVVDAVVGQQVQLSSVRLTFISGKNLLVANLGSLGGTELRVTPTSFGGGTLSLGGAF